MATKLEQFETKWKEDAVRKAVSQGALSDDSPLVMLYNLEAFKATLQAAKQAFPSNFLHTVAVKSNPILVSCKYLIPILHNTRKYWPNLLMFI
jgi:hypothetical protein